jgi:hypothetical protein
VVAAKAPKPGLFAPQGEKRLYKILAMNGLRKAGHATRFEQVADRFPGQRIAAATLAGDHDQYLRRYAPVKAFAMDAGDGREELMPLSRDLVIIQLATLHILAGHLDQAEATAACLKDTPAAREVRRKIAAARGSSVGRPGD